MYLATFRMNFVSTLNLTNLLTMMNPAILGLVTGLVGKYITQEQNRKAKEREVFNANLKGADELFFALMNIISRRLYLSQSLIGAIEGDLTEAEVHEAYRSYRACIAEYNTERVAFEVNVKRFFGESASQAFMVDVHGYNPAKPDDILGLRELGVSVRELYELWEKGGLGTARQKKKHFAKFYEILNRVSPKITAFYNRLSDQINSQRLGDRAPK